MARLVSDLWASLRAFPLWVQVWVAVILVPVNLLSLLFMDQPFGTAIAVMAVGGMVPNVFLAIYERGFSKAMSIPHLIFWIPLLLLGLGMVTGDLGLTNRFVAYLWVLLLVDAISLGFDVPDTWKWWQGDRAIAGK